VPSGLRLASTNKLANELLLSSELSHLRLKPLPQPHSFESVHGTSANHIIGVVHSDQNLVRILSVESALLGTLPPELIFRILDFMNPYDMAGFSCACRRTLLLFNRKLDTEGRELDPLRTYISRTSAFNEFRRTNLERLLAENGTTSGCFDPGSFSDDDSDL
jgi:hypothetical protein